MSEDKKEPESTGEENGNELIYKYNRELFYHFDPEKGYTQEVNYQNPGNQIIIRQSWDAASERLEMVSRQVQEGKRSPIAYYMEKTLMEVPMLAGYMEISKWRVKRHLKPGVFKKLSPDLLARYARVFDISVDELKNPVFNK